MLTCLMTLTLAAALGQTPADAEAMLLKSVPADAEIVVRMRGVEPVRDDLLAMIRAMSPNLADQVEPALNQAVEQLETQLNEQATQVPIVALIKGVAPEQGGSMPPFAVLVQAKDYEAVLKALNGGQMPTLKKVDGLDSFPGPQGDTVYSAQGDGYVVFGVDQALVRGASKPSGKSLTEALPAEMTERLLGGELGLYVNVATLASRYSEEIDAARKQIVATMEQAGDQVGNAGMMKSVGEMYGQMFEAIKIADGLVLNFDFDKAALDITGELTLKPDSKAAAELAKAENKTAENLAKMPADAAYYVYMNVDPSLFSRFQQMGMSMMYGGGEPSPEMKKALAIQQDIGKVETVGASTVANGMRTLNVMTVENPEKLMEMTIATQKAMETAKLGDQEFVKKVDVQPDAENYKGFSFTRSTVTFNLDAFAASQPNNPAAVEMMRGMFGGDSMTTWTGTDGKTVLSVAAPSWDEAKAQIDTYMAGDQGIGASKGFQEVRRMLPEKVTALMLISAQGFVRQMASQFSAMFGQQIPVPGDMPKEPALMGIGLATSPKGYQFELVVPSPVGPVIEQGLLPIFSGMQGRVNQ